MDPSGSIAFLFWDQFEKTVAGYWLSLRMSVGSGS